MTTEILKHETPHFGNTLLVAVFLTILNIMRKIEVKVRQIIWAIKQSFKPTTYDLVIFQEKEYYIKSSLTGENVWNLFEKGEKEPTHRYIKGQDLKVVQSIKRFANVFKNHLKFQKQSWGLIDCGNPIGTRLSYNNSEDIYFRVVLT